VVAAAVLMLVAGVAGCGGSEEAALPPPTKTTPTATTPTVDPTDAWRDDYTEDQLAAYDAALRRWEAYESRAEPIWTAGKATDQAQELFKEYFADPAWRWRWDDLKFDEANEVKEIGIPGIYWSRAKSISETSVSIVQCADYTNREIIQSGKPAESDDNWIMTHERRDILLVKAEGHDWLIQEVKDPISRGKPKPCAP
jgi:predicted small lipoprotein YifL